MTPAPWTLKQHATNHQTLTGATAGLIADIHNDEDARLLAAAPDLLKALKALVSTARTFRNVPKDEQEWTSIDDDALEAAFYAIAKATGEQA